MNTQACPHCGQPVLRRAESAQDIPRTQGPLLARLAHVEQKGEKDAAGKQVRRVKVVRAIDFYRVGA